MALLLLSAAPCHADTVRGYIITLEKDTIAGSFKLPRINPATGAMMVYGYDLELLHYEVYFKPDAYEKYYIYYPEEVLEFSFTFREERFVYNSFLIPRRSMIRGERPPYKFLRLIYQGAVKVFKEKQTFLDQHSVVPGQNSITYYDFYVFSDVAGLTMLGESKDIHNLRDLLKFHDLDPGFIQRVPLKKRFKDILSVLREYDAWLAAIKAA